MPKIDVSNSGTEHTGDIYEGYSSLENERLGGSYADAQIYDNGHGHYYGHDAYHPEQGYGYADQGYGYGYDDYSNPEVNRIDDALEHEQSCSLGFCDRIDDVLSGGRFDNPGVDNFVW